MRLLKGFLFVLLGFFILVTLISFLFPSKVITVKAVTIHASEEKIFSAINDLQQWKNWHPIFVQLQSKVEISSPSEGTNAKASWSLNNKLYSIVFSKVEKNFVQFNVNSSEEKPVETTLAILYMQEPGTLQVEWRAITHLKWYPWEKFAGIFVSEMTGPGYQQALDALQKYIEQGN
ncbi:MAG TPA: SRPBCC family protein [Ferruginibacter sp.]|nr:SRPBCC family protein [Ferruginibacter sp.]HRE63913.1 SRPBCC family protein [Ferruginibacter sp.]